MTLIMHYGIEQGGIKTKAQKEAEQKKNVDGLVKMFGLKDNRSKE